MRSHAWLLVLCLSAMPGAAGAGAEDDAKQSNQALAYGKTWWAAVLESNYGEITKQAIFPISVQLTHYAKACDGSAGEVVKVASAAELQPYLQELTRAATPHSKEEIRTQSTDSGYKLGTLYDVGFRTGDRCGKLFEVQVLPSGKWAGLHTASPQSLEEFEKVPAWVSPLLKSLLNDPIAKASLHFHFPVTIRSSRYEAGQAGDCSVTSAKTKVTSAQALAKPFEMLRKAARSLGQPRELNEKGWWGVAAFGDCEHVWAFQLDLKKRQVTGLWGDFD